MTLRCTRRAVLCLLMTSVAAIAVCGVASGAPSSGAAWNVSVVTQPTNLVVGGGSDQYVLVLTNTGRGAVSNGTVTVTDTLPAGVTVARAITSSGWKCSVGGSDGVVTCLYVGGEVGSLGQTGRHVGRDTGKARGFADAHAAHPR